MLHRTIRRGDRSAMHTFSGCRSRPTAADRDETGQTPRKYCAIWLTKGSRPTPRPAPAQKMRPGVCPAASRRLEMAAITPPGPAPRVRPPPGAEWDRKSVGEGKSGDLG